ncbi:MAG: dihydrofolate reductase [Lachnospiraceae bacterium]|nr:dihydrofolate reductase [Lachnospiraceae bacterium]
MNLIAAVDNNWAIGYKGNLLVRISADLKRFAKLTTGHVVVLGRKTLSTFPGGLPLKNRVNVILTRNEDNVSEMAKEQGAIIVHSKEEALEVLKQYNDDEIFIIGGESIYKLFLDKVNKAYITKIDYSYVADAHIPDLEKEGFVLTEEEEEETVFDIVYNYCTYERK